MSKVRTLVSGRLVAKEMCELGAVLLLAAVIPLLFGSERGSNALLVTLGIGWVLARASVYGVSAWRRRRRSPA